MKKVLIFILALSLMPILNPLMVKDNSSFFAYAKEKKKPKGVKVEGAAKVWNGQEFVTTDESISPKENNTIFGAANVDNTMPENCIKPGKMIEKDGNYYYQLADGTFAQTTWVNVDIDMDGLYEYLYFGPGGVMKVNSVTPNGSKVNDYGALIDANGNVKKYTAVVAEPNTSGISSFTITKAQSERQVDRTNQVLTDYLNEVMQKGEMTSKVRIKNILSYSGMPNDQVEQYAATFDWATLGSEYIKRKTDFTSNTQYVRRINIENDFKGCGLTLEEANKAFELSGYSDWDTYTIAFVNKILNSTAVTSDDKMIKALVSHGMTTDDAKSALSKIYGREIVG